MNTKLITRIVAIAATTLIILTTISVNKNYGQIVSTQILSVKQMVNGTSNAQAIEGIDISFSYFNPPGSAPLFLNIYAQVQGNPANAWVAMNVYLDTFPNPRVLTRGISLSNLGIPDNVRVPNLNLHLETSPNATIAPSNIFNFLPYPCPLDTFFFYDTDNGDPAGVGGGQPNAPIDFAGPVQGGKTRGCNVPNVDLDRSAHAAGSGYAGDQNACAPAAVANSLSWIQGSNPLIGTDGLTERQRLEEISGLMGRKNNGTVTAEEIIQGKIAFIAKHNLKLRVEYHHASGNFAEDLLWLNNQYNAGQDIEFDYTYVADGKTLSHAVVLTGLKKTGNVTQISYKDDKDQMKAGGTEENTADIRQSSDGHMVFVRNNAFCTINNMYAESYDPNAGTYVDPNTGGVSTTFCQKTGHVCAGACPPLVSFYSANQTPIVAYPECNSNKCCDIKVIYTAASGACQEKKGKCKGVCNAIYRSKSDAANGANPIQGKCEPSGGCKCKYKVDKKYNRLGEQDDVLENLAEGKLYIFPNPATQQVNIRVEDFIGSYQLQLINILGEKILVKSIELNGEEIYTVDITSLADGIYQVILSDENDIYSGTLVK